MKIRKIAAITLLVLSSFAANNVAPSKTELETMYDKAFKEFDASNYEQALKDLDAIDARQPDLAESQNLRGVILMRQKDYPNAEKALQKALSADPKFWNARFNLAEIPFLEKNWAEARKRFQDLLNGNAAELQGEATQLIQYKVMITNLMEGKGNLVEAAVNKFELAPETPALQYATAAIALNKKDEKAAREALATAEKDFSPQLNKLFAESLYEVGWLEKPVGQTRAALELNSVAEKAAKTKAFAKAKFDEAEQALQQRDFTAARKLVDEADAADPNQAQTVNLRGEILLEQKDWDGAETEFKKAAKIDPKFNDAQYNLAQIPFKQKEYTKARERFEALFSVTSGTDKDRAAQLIKYKVYLTYLLEGKDSRAQKMMEQFQFTGDTPALYYAQAAWEFKHANEAKANDWVTSARKIYPPALNAVFADALFDLGWLQSAEPAASPGVAVADAGSQNESAPVIEPTPLPAVTLAKNEPAPNNDPLTLAAQPNAAVPGMEATTSTAEQAPPASAAIEPAASPSVETPVASTASPAAAEPVVAAPSEAPSPAEEISAPKPAATAPAVASASPATVLAPAQVREWSGPTLGERLRAVLWPVMLLAGILLLAFVVLSILRRRSFKPSSREIAPIVASSEDVDSIGAVEQLVSPTQLAGGPPQVSLQLRASEPALRRATVPVGKTGRMFSGANGLAGAAISAQPEVSAQPEPVFGSLPNEPETFEGVGEPQTVETIEAVEAVAPIETIEAVAAEAAPEIVDEPVQVPLTEFEYVPEPAFVAAQAEPAPVVAATDFAPAFEPAFEPEAMTPVESPAPFEAVTSNFEPAPVFDVPAIPVEEDLEPIGQGQPIPYLTAVTEDEPAEEIAAPPEPVLSPLFAGGTTAVGLAALGALRHSVESPALAPENVSTEPPAQQSTTPATMPDPIPTPAPTIRTGPNAPMAGTAPQQQGVMRQPIGGMQPAMQGGNMHTAVQLTLSFEIASLQLTPTFKMGALQLKPTSKIVTMRLAPSQNPQPAMNLQVTFEIASVQLAGNGLGMVRLTPSQQQRPGISSSPSFNIAGLALVSGSDAAPVQLTPSQQGQASVHVTGAFQIATVEFSPSFEIASIVLNATSKKVMVQLPGTGPSTMEGAPIFEITNVQLAGNGDIGMMQLNPQTAGPKPA